MRFFLTLIGLFVVLTVISCKKQEGVTIVHSLGNTHFAVSYHSPLQSGQNVFVKVYGEEPVSVISVYLDTFFIDSIVEIPYRYDYLLPDSSGGNHNLYFIKEEDTLIIPFFVEGVSRPTIDSTFYIIWYDTIYNGNKGVIYIDNAHKDVQVYFSNDFVATIDSQLYVRKTTDNYEEFSDGEVECQAILFITTHHAGKTLLRVYNDEVDMFSEIEIMSNIFVYKQPEIEFGYSKSMVENSLGRPDNVIRNDSVNRYVYSNYQYGIRLIINYDNSDNVDNYSLMFTIKQTDPTVHSQIVMQIEDMYEYFLSNATKNIYIDAYEYDQASKVVILDKIINNVSYFKPESIIKHINK